jgi:hypothetical protein
MSQNRQGCACGEAAVVGATLGGPGAGGAAPCRRTPVGARRRRKREPDGGRCCGRRRAGEHDAAGSAGAAAQERPRAAPAARQPFALAAPDRGGERTRLSQARGRHRQMRRTRSATGVGSSMSQTALALALNIPLFFAVVSVRGAGNCVWDLTAANAFIALWSAAVAAASNSRALATKLGSARLRLRAI